MIPRSNSTSSTDVGNYTSFYNTTDYSGSATKGNSLESFNGFDIERYSTRRKRGELLPITPFNKTNIVNSNHIYSYDFTDNYNNHGWTNDRGFTNAFLTESFLNDKITGLDLQPYVNSAAASIYSSGHDTLTFLSELSKTGKMFTGIVERFKTLIRNGDIGNAWLEYRYGWRTLYFDLVSLSKAISNLDNSRSRYSQKVGNKWRYDESFVINDIDTTGAGSLNALVEDVIEISVRGTVVADISPPSFRFDPITTAWELVRFSFIVDWFIQIGGWLSSMNFLMYQTKYSAAGGVKLTLTRTITKDSVISASGYSMTGTCSGTSTGSLIVRTPTTVSTIPQIQVNLDSLKVLDLMAIIKQVL